MKILQFLCALVLVLLIVAGIYFVSDVVIKQHQQFLEQQKQIRLDKQRDAFAVNLAKQSLSEQKDITVNAYETNFDCKFNSGKESNTAVVKYLDRQYMRRDVNKSLMIGKFVGEKSKEFAKGLKDGIMSKSKHREPTNVDSR